MNFALIGALCIGLSLGLLGSGGSILTVPVLVLLLHRPEKTAIAESLGIVGGIALIAALPYAMKREVSWRNVLFFGVPGMAGAWTGALASRTVTGDAQLALFAVIMLVAGVMMLRGTRASDATEQHIEIASAAVHEIDASPAQILQPPRVRRPIWRIAIDGLLVGLVTGFVGVGGGFLIVPALVLLGGQPMRRAVGTSLCIIAMNSAAGLSKHLQELPPLGLSVDWNVVSIFLAVGVVGSLVGNFVGGFLNQQVLRRVFSVFLLLVGTYILVRQIFAVIS